MGRRTWFVRLNEWGRSWTQHELTVTLTLERDPGRPVQLIMTREEAEQLSASIYRFLNSNWTDKGHFR